MDNRKYSSINDVMEHQRQRCDLLKKSTEVLFGLDKANQELVEELSGSVDAVKTGISELKIMLRTVKGDNKQLQETLCRQQSLETLVNDVENHTDFQRLFCNCEEEKAKVSTPVRTPKKTVLHIQHITYEDLENVPFYIKGRMKLEDINEFISSVNSTIIKKYHIVRSRSIMRYEEKQLQFLYKQQERLCPGLTFITEDDLKKFGMVRSTVAVNKLLNVLRATHRLKEVRSDGFVRFVVA